MTPRPERHAPAHVSAALDRLGLQLDEDYPVSQPAPARPTPATPTQTEMEALVVRLNQWAKLGTLTLGQDAMEAAAALTALLARVAELEAELEFMSDERNHETYD